MMPAQRQLQQLGQDTQHATRRLHAGGAARHSTCPRKHTPSKQHTPRTGHTLQNPDTSPCQTHQGRPDHTPLGWGVVCAMSQPQPAAKLQHAHATRASEQATPSNSGCTAHRQRKTTHHRREEAWCSPPPLLPPFRGCSCKGKGEHPSSDLSSTGHERQAKHNLSHRTSSLTGKAQQNSWRPCSTAAVLGLLCRSSTCTQRAPFHNPTVHTGRVFECADHNAHPHLPSSL